MWPSSSGFPLADMPPLHLQLKIWKRVLNTTELQSLQVNVSADATCVYWATNYSRRSDLEVCEFEGRLSRVAGTGNRGLRALLYETRRGTCPEGRRSQGTFHRRFGGICQRGLASVPENHFRAFL